MAVNLQQSDFKTCYRCKKTLPITEFYKDRSKTDGLSPECKDCSRKRGKEYRKKNKEKLREKSQKYYQENREKILDRNRQWREKNKDKMKEYAQKHREKNPQKILEQTRKYQQEHREYYRSRNRILFKDARLKAIKHLNPELKCERCGIDDIRILTIDHKNNDGYKERQKKTSYRIYKDIAEMDIIEAKKLYQVLCRNCNWLRRYEEG